MKNLFNNQELLWLMINSFILMTFMFDSGMICNENLDASHSYRSNGKFLL